MALDKILIGARIRRIREEMLGETRDIFAKKCNLETRYIGQVERGEFLFSLSTLDQIASATGVETDYILYGKGEHEKLTVKKTLDNMIAKANTNELEMYYKCMTTVKGYVKYEIDRNKKDEEDKKDKKNKKNKKN